jgi:glycosyltransferase involved in cell wall biosynthesis
VNAQVDVILPFRDAAETISAALEGLLADGDPTIRVRAVDDGSTDSSADRVRAWSARDGRLMYLRGEGRGLSAALQRGLTACTGEFVARMDADDLTHPSRLTRQRAYLLAHRDVALVGTRVRAFADVGELGEGLVHYVAWQNGLITREEHRRERFVESPLCHPSIMVRRPALQAVGGYREFDGPEDYELFLRLEEHGFVLEKLPEVLLQWRHRAGRATFSDPRYGLDRFRAVKAPYLASELIRRRRERLVVWGAGPTGRRLARAIGEHGAHATLFIDIDERKIGRTAQGVPIASADALDPGRDLVLAAVGARGARALIRDELVRRGFREGETAWFGS